MTGFLGLAQLANLGENLADLVVLLDCLADSLIGNINAELLVQVVEYMYLHLGDICIDGVVNDLERDVDMGDEELLLFVAVEHLKMLHCTVHHRACVNTDECIEELVAALDTTLYECAGVLAGVVGHVIGCDVKGASVGCAQTHGETVA